jgi:hypothetical protein
MLWKQFEQPLVLDACLVVSLLVEVGTAYVQSSYRYKFALRKMVDQALQMLTPLIIVLYGNGRLGLAHQLSIRVAERFNRLRCKKIEGCTPGDYKEEKQVATCEESAPRGGVH